MIAKLTHKIVYLLILVPALSPLLDQNTNTPLGTPVKTVRTTTPKPALPRQLDFSDTDEVYINLTTQHSSICEQDSHSSETNGDIQQTTSQDRSVMFDNGNSTSTVSDTTSHARSAMSENTHSSYSISDTMSNNLQNTPQKRSVTPENTHDETKPKTPVKPHRRYATATPKMMPGQQNKDAQSKYPNQPKPFSIFQCDANGRFIPNVNPFLLSKPSSISTYAAPTPHTVLMQIHSRATTRQ